MYSETKPVRAPRPSRARTKADEDEGPSTRQKYAARFADRLVPTLLQQRRKLRLGREAKKNKNTVNHILQCSWFAHGRRTS
jgi:hypothetical protein